MRLALLWTSGCNYAVLCVVIVAASANLLSAVENWPQWRFDSKRTAASANSMPEEFTPLWEKRYTPRMQVWDDPLNLDLMTYDKQFEPIVLNGKLFLAFNDDCKLVAYDLKSGRELWTFYAEGPIRFAPVGWNDRLFVVSDDGFLYAISSENGNVLWKFSPAPNTQKMLGNQRIISAWPARGGPTIYGNTVYFASSIWPFMGTFICALDADSGQVEWVNDSTGSQYIKQPHSAPAFAGVAPQGFLVATSQYIVVPGGRSVPAVLDRTTGQQKHFEINAGGKGTGGAFVAADDTHYFVHTRRKGTRAFDLETGVKTAFMPNEPVITDNLIYSAERDSDRSVVRIYASNQAINTARDILGEIVADGTHDLILAKDHLIAAGPNTVSIVKLERDEAGLATRGQVTKTISIRYPVARIIVAEKTLVVVDELGGVAAFGSSSPPDSGATTGGTAPAEEAVASEDSISLPAATASERLSPASVAEKHRIYELLGQCDPQGYAYWFGPCSAPQAAAICEVSPFEQWSIVLPPDSDANALRSEIDRRKQLKRVPVFSSSPLDFRAPQFTGNLVVVSDEISKNASTYALRSIYQTVRPYGGVMVLLSKEDPASLAAAVAGLQLEQAEIKTAAFGVVVYRKGALPGSADWTHQNGDIANSIKSNDSRVKLPLGVLWFGGSSNMDVLPRHGHGPPEQVVGGRLFIEGINSLSARDVYTGRILWKRNFQDLGTYDVYFDSTYENTPLDPKYNQVHIPGANGRGTNYVVTEECIYLVMGDTCKMLDPQTGEDIGEIRLPPNANGETSEWGFIGVYKDLLIGGVGFAKYRDRHGLEFESEKELKSSKLGFGSKSLDRAASLGLVGFNRFTGEVLWRVDSKHSFWHNGIVAGGDKIYCLDKNPKRVEDAMKRRGLEMPDSYRIVALDYRSGSTLWEVKENVFGTWLGYSVKHNMLLQAGAAASDRLADEVGQGMAVYDADTGKVVWEKQSLKYSGPCILHNDLVITNTNSYNESAGAFNILNGQQKMTKNPITGKFEPWRITRAYGCNSIIASENLLTFRSGAAGYYDLNSESGTGNFGGFRSGCTANLVAANGVLNAPDYTRTCSCSYQNQTSLALVHIPDVELWSVNPIIHSKLDVQQIDALGINFGAPGDRRSPDGTLWIEYPHESGEPLPISVDFNDSARPYRHHSSRYDDSPISWIVSSGISGVTEMTLKLQSPPSEATDKSKDLAEKSDEGQNTRQSTPAIEGFYDIELIFSVPKPVETDTNYSMEVTIDGHDRSQNTILQSRPDDKTLEGRAQFERVRMSDTLTVRIKAMEGTPALCGIRLTRSR